MERPGIKPPKQCLQKNKQPNKGSSIICVGKVKEDSDDSRRQCLPLPPLPPEGFRHFVPQGGLDQLGNSFEDNDVSQTLRSSVDESHPHFGGALYSHQFAPMNNQQPHLPSTDSKIGVRIDSDFSRENVFENENGGRDDEEEDGEEEVEEEGDDEEQEVADSGEQEIDDLDVSISITDSSSAAAKAAARNLNQLKMLTKSKESIGSRSMKSLKENNSKKHLFHFLLIFTSFILCSTEKENTNSLYQTGYCLQTESHLRWSAEQVNSSP